MRAGHKDGVVGSWSDSRRRQAVHVRIPSGEVGSAVDSADSEEGVESVDLGDADMSEFDDAVQVEHTCPSVIWRNGGFR